MGRFWTIAAILILALVLKLHNYATFPQRGATSDEYTYSFLGLSLLTQGFPISWSNFNLYPRLVHLTINKLYFPIVYPYFDHPPLNGIVVAVWALFNGENSFEKISLATIRLVPIVFSLLSATLVYLIAKKIYHERIATYALLIYTTTTIFVISGRVVLAENLLTVWLLLTIYLLAVWQKINSIFRALTLGFLAGLAVWTKELGIAVFFTSLFFLIKNRCKSSLFLIYHLTFSVFFLGYIAYGTYYDAELFGKIINVQASRQLGPQILDMLLHHQYIVNKPSGDGWYYLGWLALFVSLWQFGKHRLIVLPALTYFFLMLFSLTREGEMGWYVIPMFPLMAIATANLIDESTKVNSRGNWFSLMLPLLVGLSQVRSLFETNFGLTTFQFRLMLVLIFGPFAVFHLLNQPAWFARFGKFWFYLLILGNIIQTYAYQHPA